MGYRGIGLLCRNERWSSTIVYRARKHGESETILERTGHGSNKRVRDVQAGGQYGALGRWIEACKAHAPTIPGNGNPCRKEGRLCDLGPVQGGGSRSGGSPGLSGEGVELLR